MKHSRLRNMVWVIMAIVVIVGLCALMAGCDTIQGILDDLGIGGVQDSIALDSATVTLEVGDTATLTATHDSGTVEWSSSNEAVATVSQEGVVTAKAVGTATITATVGSASATCTVTVTKPADSISINPHSLSLTVGERDSLGVVHSEGTVVWTSSNEAVATVSQDGVVTAVAGGTATITATLGTAGDTCTVRVWNPGEVTNEELSIHFLELGNKYTGDCTLIKIGDTEVLIDAGSRNGSAATIVPYVQQYCTDGKLDYVIATHAHQDHIAGFVGTKAAPGVFDSFDVGTIIEFAQTNATSQVYKDYCAERDEAVKRGAKCFTAQECYYETDSGAQKTYTLAPGVTMDILYNYYYDNKSSDENNYSVCVLLTQGSNHYLFTGDLEGDGEEYLVEYNRLPKVKLFKGGHHGSYTANTPTLLSVIQPEIVCVCCCCGSPEYTENFDNMFPSQAFVDNVMIYTDQIYVTTMADWNDDLDSPFGYKSMNGNIVVTSTGGEVEVNCSNNNTILSETEWFKTHRRKPADAVDSTP